MDHESVEEIKRHFGVVAEDVRSDVRAVAEGPDLANERLNRLEGGQARLDQRLDRLDQRLDRLDQRVDRGFGELQSMIRLSYAEIDRRFDALETEVSDLRSRVERLEQRGA
jgi:predicted nuclease with TOPRIM domain